jgi:CubicO group peptidase (beta-lactamase class C family)
MATDAASREVEAALALLEAHLEVARQDLRIPGLSAAVVLDQDMLWSRGFGLADHAREIPATPQTLYRVGSITKPFTAMMLMQLRDAGQLQLDDPLARYVPEFHLASHLPDPRPATFRQVAAHVAGLPREAPLDYWRTLEFPAVASVLASLPRAEMVFPSYTEIKYSNFGYTMLGLALERIAGQPYVRYVTERILQPLGMASSGFEVPERLRPHLAAGYAPAGDGDPPVAPHPHLAGMVPVGGLYSTVEDIARFIALQFRDGPAGGTQILGGSSLREMHAPVFLDAAWQSGRGIGWALNRVAGYPAVGHGGGIHGYTTNITFIPALKLGVAVFTNTGTEPAALSRTALELLAPVVSRLQHGQRPGGAEDTAPEDVRRYTGRYSMAGIVELDVQVSEGRLIGVVPGARSGAGTEVRLVHEGGHRFRTHGGPVSGEVATFEPGEGGIIVGVQLGPYPLVRVPGM